MHNPRPMRVSVEAIDEHGVRLAQLGGRATRGQRLADAVARVGWPGGARQPDAARAARETRRGK